MFVHVLLSQETVAADCQPMVTGEDDNRIVASPGFFQLLQDSTDLPVHVINHGVVGCKLIANIVLGSW